MPNDEGSRSTTSDFKKDDTQPLAPVSAPPTLPAREVPTPPPLVPESQVTTPPSLSSPRPIEAGSPRPIEAGSAQMRLERSVRLLWMMMAAVATLALVSLAVNVALVTRLLAIRTAIAGTLNEASRSLDDLGGQGLAFEFPISQTVSFEGDVPFKQEMTFPFKGNIPIDTTISVPMDIGLLGRQVINVPVKTTVPVDITVPVRVDQTIHIKTQVPVRMSVPIRVSANDPPLKDWIAQARQWLARIRRYV